MQKTIAMDLGLWTIPETGFFLRNPDSLHGRISAMCGLYYAANDRVLKSRIVDPLLAMSYLARTVRTTSLLRSFLSARGSARLFQEYFDINASKNGLAGWLEKTPKHFQQIDRIRASVECAKFIFVMRNGEDVVASIKERYNKFPERFPNQKDYLYGVHLWNESMRNLGGNESHNDVHILCYEDFVVDSARAVSRVSGFLGLQRDKTASGGMGGLNIARHHETWKSHSLGEVAVQESRFGELFNEAERKEIRKLLNMDTYHRIRRNLNRDESAPADPPGQETKWPA